MKYLVILIGISGHVMGDEYLSTVQFVIHETSPQLLERAQNLVLDQFSNSMQTQTILSNRGYQIRLNGNQVTLNLVSETDLADPMQMAVSSMIGELNGRVHTRGGAKFYRTAMTAGSLGGVLDVVTDNDHSKIKVINAQSVPLRDLLKELKNQVGTFSYLIPGECSERFVDWSFGGETSEPKSFDVALEELATLFGLKLAKQSGTYIFSGNCAVLPTRESNNFVNFFPPEKARRRLFFPVQMAE